MCRAFQNRIVFRYSYTEVSPPPRVLTCADIVYVPDPDYYNFPTVNAFGGAPAGDPTHLQPDSFSYRFILLRNNGGGGEGGGGGGEGGGDGSIAAVRAGGVRPFIRPSCIA